MELRLYFQTYTTVLLLVFYVSIASLSSVHIKYVRHSLSPARLSQPYDNVDGVSLLTCSALCSIGENCFGISFHRLISRCELVNKTEYFGEYQTNNDGWRVYGNVIGKFFHLWNGFFRTSVIPAVLGPIKRTLWSSFRFGKTEIKEILEGHTNWRRF